MKTGMCVLILLILLGTRVQAQKAENIFIITTDGTRWQEIFNGADSALLHDTGFVQDTALSCQLYWDPSPEERRKRLMPFFWNVIAKQGQLYGNRTIESKVNVKNIYKISYPGYNELLTGYPDPLPILNAPQYNRNISVLEYLNGLPEYRNRVAAFTSWNVFPFILNSRRNTMMQNSGYAVLSDTAESIRLANKVQDSVAHKDKTRYDLLTFFNAREYIRLHHPRVVFLALGETDEFAHKSRYDLYLQQLANVDKMIAELWYAVQTDPFYKNNTTFLISTDHGRGRREKWVKHHTFVPGSGEIWLALLGKNILPVGEMKGIKTVYQSQVAATVAFLLGEDFRSNRSIGKPVFLPGAEIRTAAGDKALSTPVFETLTLTNEK
ncbi:alkaline phosphatase family protein [Flavisolibacter nicotianae]|uniref:alkaline phosphatase family protein n=1 Tax=Flavisolibacter nicotianae TaxID=2364882 RepID=UPI000EAFEC9A|nr:alkaline phosphatase family protein [Flavisolibacter nicotianae]